MASIITNKLRKSIAQSIYEDILSRRNNYYYFFGNPANGVNLETTPLSTREYEGKVRRNMVAANRLYANDVAFVVPRFNWSSGQVYDKVSSLETGVIHPVNGPKFYVYDDQNYRVYKCIDNNYGAASTVRPTSTSAYNVTTADGYVWRYMYTIPAGMRNKFLTADYLPVFNSLQSRYYSDGGLNELVIVKSGSGYAQATTWIEVVGDGTGAVLEPVIYNGQLGDVIVRNPGRDYTKATLIVRSSASGQGAEVVADLNVGDLDSDQALVELLSTPGTVDSIDVTTIGTGYAPTSNDGTGSTVKIIGDGSGATAQLIVNADNTISRIKVTNPGTGYSWAQAVVTPQTNPSRTSLLGTYPAVVDVVCRVNVSQNLGHGRDAVDEFHSNSLMFHSSVYTDRLSDFDVVATYKQHGIIKNIRNYDYSVNIHDQVSPKRYQVDADFGPIINFYGGGGQGAVGRVNVTGKNIQNIFLEDGGKDYTSVPTVNITGGGGSGASAVATISARVDSTSMASAISYGGVGYYSPPQVILTSTTGSGARITSSISTGVGAIDITNQGSSYTSAPTVSFTGGGGGTDAAATAYVNNGKIIKVVVTNPGTGYTAAPTVVFTGTGINAAATAVLTGTTSALTLNSSGSKYQSSPSVSFRGSCGVSDIKIIDSGEGFTSNPTISVTGGGGNGATAEAFVENCIRKITLTNQGSGYTSAPTVDISGGGAGAGGASATAVVSNGKVTDIIITSRGYSFTSIPTISFTGGSGSGAQAVASIGAGIVAVNITNPGSGYTSTPTINVVGGGTNRKGFVFEPVLGTASAQVGIIGSVSSITMTSQGNNYTSTPTVSFSGGSGTGALAYAKVVGQVSSITMLDYGYGYVSTPTAVISGGEGVGAVINAIISGGGITSCSVSKGGSNYILTKFANFIVGSVLVDEANREFTIMSANTNNKTSSLIIRSNSGFVLPGAVVKLRKKLTSDYFITKTTLSQRFVESRFPSACYTVSGFFDVNSVPDGSIMTITDQTNGDKYYRVISTLEQQDSGFNRLLLQPLNGGRINTNMSISGPVTFTVTAVTEPEIDSRTGDVLMIANSSTEFTQNQDQTLSFRTVINF
jgi:hypothetical protein